jgi:hypothetical protein
MDTKAIVMFVAGVTLFLLIIGIGAWIMTAPLEAGEVEMKRCNEYVYELEMLNKYKWFWTSYHRRMAFNDCLTRNLGDTVQP